MNIPQFKNPALLRQAFIHRSFLNEHKNEISSNERLEFLGDAILSYVVSSWLYERQPDKPEGVLTNIRSKLVNTRSLARLSSSLGLGDKLMLSKGEEEGGGRTNPSLLADTYEAVIGAIYLDQGLIQVKNFIFSTLLNNTSDLESDLKDSKSLLQEISQAKGYSSPVYKIVSESGPDHLKEFTVSVEINGTPAGQGSGKNKREAETQAAKSALAKFGQS